MPSAQLIFLRGSMATSLVLLVVQALGATKRLGGVVQPRVLVRAAVDACATVLFQAERDLLMRRIDPTIPSIVVTLPTSVAVALLAGALSLWQGWRPFAARDLALLGLASAFLASAYFLLVKSMRQGDMSLTAPFLYSALLFAMLLGYAVSGDVPDACA